MVSRIYEELLHLKNKNVNNQAKNFMNVLEDPFLIRYMNGQHAHERMLNILSH